MWTQRHRAQSPGAFLGEGRGCEAWSEELHLEGREGTELKGTFRKASTAHWIENSGEFDVHM